ncbi:MAG: tRNA (N6-isopentenyl adenosine(37)-C2)-methylthiotransferase MiaB, partial [Spirochaetes bacterium]|nr:tRNA (N6-isopentenyl adenosine(37)-C2)-methylthiotransferase MiaB [Spirochaetota bacterium]
MKIPKTFTIVTFGCQMNKSDSELMEVSLTQEGFIKSTTYGDIIIFNTCSVRKHAEDRALAHIVEASNAYKHSIIVVAGCMAQRLSWEIRNKYNVDL